MMSNDLCFVPISDLVRLVSDHRALFPFKDITQDDVLSEVARGNSEALPFNVLMNHNPELEHQKQIHINRIAYFVRYGVPDDKIYPISLGYKDRKLVVYEGRHRIAAALTLYHAPAILMGQAVASVDHHAPVLVIDQVTKEMISRQKAKILAFISEDLKWLINYEPYENSTQGPSGVADVSLKDGHATKTSQFSSCHHSIFPRTSNMFRAHGAPPKKLMGKSL